MFAPSYANATNKKIRIIMQVMTTQLKKLYALYKFLKSALNLKHFIYIVSQIWDKDNALKKMIGFICMIELAFFLVETFDTF